jgi:hypothetical protein
MPHIAVVPLQRRSERRGRIQDGALKGAHRKANPCPLCFKINLAGGHGGSSGCYDRLREAAFRYAFILDAVGLIKSGTND